MAAEKPLADVWKELEEEKQATVFRVLTAEEKRNSYDLIRKAMQDGKTKIALRKLRGDETALRMWLMYEQHLCVDAEKEPFIDPDPDAYRSVRPGNTIVYPMITVYTVRW